MRNPWRKIPSAGRAAAAGLIGFLLVWLPLDLFRNGAHMIPDWLSNAILASLVAAIWPLHILTRERIRLSEQIVEGEKQFRRIAEASPAGILYMSRDLRALYVNRRWGELGGLQRPRERLENWLDIIHSADRHEAEAMARRVATNGVPATVVLRLAAPSSHGELVYGELRVHPEFRDGVIEGLVARILDVTERRRAKSALAEREAQYRLLTENMDDLIIRLGGDGTIRFATLAVRRALGIEPEALVGKSLGAIVLEQDRPILSAILADLNERRRTVNALLRLESLKGRPVWFEGHFRVATNVDGSDGGIVVAMRDVQARHEAEEREKEAAVRLRESNRVLRMAERMAEIEHWSVAGQSGAIDGSDGVRDVTRRGLSTAARILDRVNSTDRMKLLRLAVLARQGRRAEAVIELDDGELVRTVRLAARADEAGQGEEGDLFGVARDITTERATEDELIEARDQARAAAHARANFLAAMSHEIRTPMTGVFGMIDLLRSDPTGPESERYMTTLKQSADLLMAVLDDILDFEKIESGSLKLETRDVDLETLVQSSVALFSNSASRKGLLLKYEGERDRLTLVRADPVRLKQVLCNLISNAIKFTEKGSVTVRLLPLEEPTSAAGDGPAGDGQIAAPPRHRMRFEVSDTGTGLDPVQAARLFEPFVQADTSIARRFGGTGLGLAISRRLVEAMGGTMRADGAPGKGAIFTFDLEFDAGEELALAQSVRKADWTRMPAMRILVAEDNPVNQMIISAMLSRMGHEVVTVDDGRRAVEAAGKAAYDAILMDMQMPELDGLAATREIRASGGPCAHIPILALTADASPERRRFYDGAGLTDFLTKPIDRAVLGARLADIAEERQEAKVADAKANGDVGAEVETELVLALNDGGSADGPHKESSKIFDADRLDEIRQALGEERCGQLLSLLANECRERPDSLHANAEAGDHDRLRAEAHALKGAALNIGAIALGEAAAAVEHSDPSDAIEAMLIRLDGAAEQTLKAIRNGRALFGQSVPIDPSATPPASMPGSDGGTAARITNAHLGPRRDPKPKPADRISAKAG